MQDTITVKWEVSDGYVGRDRPQETIIDLEDYFDKDEWDNLPEEEKKEYISEKVQEDFENKISFEINDYGI